MSDDKMEFWNGLARLYEETLEIKEDILRLEKLAETQQRAARNLQVAYEALRDYRRGTRVATGPHRGGAVAARR